MKKKVFYLMAIAMFTGLAFVFVDESKASVSSDCPNGCKPGTKGCYCKKYYSYYSEAKWTDPTRPTE